ncbi:MAG: DoxX family protein [Rikenellaceae bacterium]|jgi:uncharacterized membrane protein YphA (DoxX/SURF4 family)|nr:DoxX family protein [Rikenellaceae bacterium]
MYNKRSKTVPAGIHLVRIVLAVVFIASGFLKGVDPWSGAIKMGEYFSAFGMEWLDGVRFPLAIGQAAFEMWLGLMLLFNLWRTFTRFFVLLFMVFFTGLTLFIALTNPVSDCGCFGDAIPLTNWQTFFKNLVLLPLSILLFAHIRREIVTRPIRSRYGIVAILAVLALWPGLRGLRSLPAIDFLPYKVGANLPSKIVVAPEDRGESHTTLIYRDRASGQEQEFEVSDTTWYDTLRWEFVDTRTVVLSEGKEPEINNFVLFNAQQDMTDWVLTRQEVFLLVADRLEEVDERTAERFARVGRFAEQNNIPVVCLTISSLEKEAEFQQKIGLPIPCLNVDATTLKTMLRAHRGMILLERGTIIAKMNLRQMPDFEKAGVHSGLEYVAAKGRAGGEKLFIAGYLLLILGLLLGGRKRCNE